MHTFYNAVTAYMFKHHIEDIDTWAQDSKGMTILHYLSWSSRSAVQDLIRCTKPGMFSLNKCQSSVTSQLSIKDAQGKSVLHYAVQRGNLGLITFLLDRPDAVTLGMPDYLGCTLLHYATESSRTEAIDLFLYRGLDIDAADDKGRTVLHHACQWGNLKAVKHLLDLGFEHQLDVVDHDKRTPMQLAELYRSKAVVEYLRDIYSDQTVSDLDSEMKHVRVCTCKTSLSEGSTRYIGRISISTFLIFALLVHLAIVSLQGRG
jgi:ankyrin repeat protein